MRAVLWALVILGAPGGLFVAQVEGLRWLAEGEPPRALRPLIRLVRDLRRSWRAPRHEESLPPVLLALELRRLGEHVQRIEQDRQPHRAARLGAALAAYDHVLLQLCDHARVETPAGLPPLSARARLDLETELVASGVDW